MKILKMVLTAAVAAISTAMPAVDAATTAAAKAAPAPKTASLAEARAKISEAIADPAKLTAAIKGLSAADQCAFLAEVNSAIATSGGSVEARTAKYLNANRAALKGAAKGNLKALLAVTFSTVPPESLTLLATQFATDLFGRNAGGTNSKVSDAAFEKIALETVTAVAEKSEGLVDSAVRITLAAYMFVKASGGQPEGLGDRLLAKIANAKEREAAQKEWLPAALNGNFEAMLAYADAGRMPVPALTLQFAGPQMLDALLGRLSNVRDLGDSFFNESLPTAHLYDDDFGRPTRTPKKSEPVPPPEPKPYQLQESSAW